MIKQIINFPAAAAALYVYMYTGIFTEHTTSIYAVHCLSVGCVQAATCDPGMAQPRSSVPVGTVGKPEFAA